MGETYVAAMGTPEKRGKPLGCNGNFSFKSSPVNSKANGKWRRNRSRYSRLSSFNVCSSEGRTLAGSKQVIHNFEVTHRSPLLAFPEAINALMASPTSSWFCFDKNPWLSPPRSLQVELTYLVDSSAIYMTIAGLQSGKNRRLSLPSGDVGKILPSTAKKDQFCCRQN